MFSSKHVGFVFFFPYKLPFSGLSELWGQLRRLQFFFSKRVRCVKSRLCWCSVSSTKCIGCLGNCIDPIPTSLASLHPRSDGTGLTATPLIERVGMRISHGAVPASNSLRNWRSRPLAWLFQWCIQSRQERYVVIRSGYMIGLWRNRKKEDQTWASGV